MAAAAAAVLPPRQKTKEDKKRARGEQEENRRPTTEEPFSPTIYSIPAECAACTESYSGADELCRITCGHVFHAEVRQDRPWGGKWYTFFLSEWPCPPPTAPVSMVL